MKRWSSIKKHRMFANHFFENVPNDRLLPFHHFARLLNRCSMRLFFQLVVNEWLEELERHLLWQSTLVKL